MYIDIRLTVDYAFKRVFGHEDTKDILISFLNAVLGLSGDDRIIHVDLKNPFSTKDFHADKQNILDIKAQDNTGRYYDIEMQVAVYESYPKRILHYACNLYSSQIDSGMSYSTLNPVISITILDNVLFSDSDRYANRFTLHNDEHDLLLCDDLTFYVFELPKFLLSDHDLTGAISEWLYLIKHIHELDFDNPPVFDYIPINKVLEVLEIMSKTQIEREQYEDRLRAQRDILTLKEDSYKKGKEEGEKLGIQKGEKLGIQKGERKKAIETAKKMKAKNLSKKLISDVTGLSIEVIEKL